MQKSLADLRVDYSLAVLDEASASPDPFAQFHLWFGEAESAGLLEPNAMILATVGADGQPSTRTVLLKHFDPRGFTFFTNRLSRKGADIAATGRAAITLLWKELQRQVNISGTVGETSAGESDAYFQSRPYASQIGAHASDQSVVIPDREWLEQRWAEAQSRYPEGKVPRPDHWGGYRVVPESIEFWQGRRSRLHDRLRYTRCEGGWRRERLSP